MSEQGDGCLLQVQDWYRRLGAALLRASTHAANLATRAVSAVKGLLPFDLGSTPAPLHLQSVPSSQAIAAPKKVLPDNAACQACCPYRHWESISLSCARDCLQDQ